MATAQLKDKLKKTAQATTKAARTAAQKGAQNAGAKPKEKEKEKNRTPVRNVQDRAKKVTQKAKDTAKAQNKTPQKKDTQVQKLKDTVKESKPVQTVKKMEPVEKALQNTLDRQRYIDDMTARSQVKQSNIARGTNLPQKSTGILKELGMQKYYEKGAKNNPNTPAGMYKTTLTETNLDQTAKLADIQQKKYGLGKEKVPIQDILANYTLDPLSLLTADSMSRANYGRWTNALPSKQKERTDKEVVQDAFNQLKENVRQRGAKQQTTSRHDNKLGQQYRDAIKLAKEDFEAAQRKGDAKGMQEAHQRAETIRRIQGGYSGGVTGDEYIKPEIDAEDIANLNKEGLTRLASAKLGYESATTDEERKRYAALGASVRRDPTFQKEEYDRGAYRNVDAEGRMRYGGTEEERQREQEQAAAIPLAALYGIGGAFGTIPGTTGRALQTEAARNQAALQNLSDIRGGGEVNVSEPAPLTEPTKAQELLRKSQEYTEKATEGQKGLDRLSTLALINLGKMAPMYGASALTGGAALPGLLTLYAQTAGEEMGTQEMNGADPVQAVNRGLIRAATETIPEALPYSKVLRMAKGGSGSYARDMATLAAENVLSDEISELAGTGADRYIFGDKDARLNAQDLADTAAISLLTALGTGTAAGMVGNVRAGRSRTKQQEQKATAVLDQATPSVDAIAQQEQALQGQIDTWKMQTRRILDRLQESVQDPTWHKHLLNELAQNQAEGEQLRQQLVTLELQKAQRTEVEQQKAQQAEQAQADALSALQNRPNINLPEAQRQAPVPLPVQPSPVPQAETPQEAAERPVLNPVPQAVQDTTPAQTPAEGRETAEEWHPRSPQYGQPENHIDNREASDLGDRKVMAFQWDHPEVRPFFREAAQALKEDAEYSDTTRHTVRASKIDQARGKKAGTVMERNEALRQLADMGMSTAEIIKACDAIINDKGQENYANAKRVELALDGMLSNGYIPVREWGNPDARIAPNEEYLRIKGDISGGTVPNSFEDYLQHNALALELGEVTEEELRQEWEAQQNQPTPVQEEPTVTKEEKDPYSVGAAPLGFDPFGEWQLGTDQYHPINPKAEEAEAENWGRAPVELPVKDPFGQLTSKTASTLMNAGMTPNEISEALANLALEGKLSRLPYTDEAAVSKAEKTIEDRGYQRAKEDWLADIKAGKMNKDLTTMGIVLYNNAANSGHVPEAIDIANNIIEYGKNAGQVLQAVNIINKLGPTGQLYSLANAMEKLEDKIRKNKELDAEHWDGVEIPEDLAKRYVEAETDEERQAIETEIKKAIAQQIPNTVRDKLDAWRFLAMLGNPRTLARNWLGNLGFQPVRIAKNALGTALERIAGIDQSERTKAIQFKGLSKADKARYDVGLEEYDTVEPIIMGNGKYNDAFSDIDQYRQIFNLKPIEKWRELTNAGLEKGDVFFAKRTYADSLAGILKARGITAEEYTSDLFDPQEKERIQAIAIEEAQKATYRDLNELSEYISGLGKRQDTKFRKGVHYLVEGLLPFKKTPANILARGLEYSPAGIAKAVVDMGAKVKSGEMSAAQAIDELSAGLTGTGLFALGAVLGMVGLVTPGDDEDKSQNKFNQLLGKQSYALRLPGGYNFTLDWMAPEAIPFFMGVELNNSMQEIQAGKKGKDIAWNFIRRISDPVLEQSMLQGVNTLLEDISYADNKPARILSSLATGYLSQFVPTIGGQIERTIEDRRYSTWIDRDSWVPGEVQYFIAKNLNKIPGIDYHQREYLDAWGDPELTGNPAVRALTNFLSPGYIKQEKGGALEEELQRLYDAGYNAFPTIAATNTEINDQPISKEQFNLMQAAKGHLMRALYTDAINSEEYKGMSDADKNDYLGKLKRYATTMGKQAAGEDPSKAPEWMQKLTNAAQEHNVEVSALVKASLKLDLEYDADGNGRIKTAEGWDGVQDMNLPENEQRALFDMYNGTSKTFDEYKAEAEAKAKQQAEVDKYLSTIPKEAQDALMEACDGKLNGMNQEDTYTAIKDLGLPPAQEEAAFNGIQAARGDSFWKKDGRQKTWQEFDADMSKKAQKTEQSKAIWGDAPQEDIDAFKDAMAANGGNKSYHAFFKSCEDSGIPRSEWPAAFNEANGSRAAGNKWHKGFEQAYYHVYGKKWTG